MTQRTIRYVLKSAEMIAPKVKYFTFEREDQAKPQFNAGQFITLHIQGPTKILHRSYSIANMPDDNNHVEFACSYVEGGVASNLLFNLKPGDVVDAGGPYGLFVLKKEEKPKRYVFIGTGTGVSPYRSMLNDIKSRFDDTHEVILLMGVRNKEELLFGQDFIHFAKVHPKFKFYACYSRETPDSLQHFERKGHVQSVFPEITLNPTDDIVYLCGNPYMIDDAFAKLTEMGFDKKSIRREKYLFSH